MNSDRDHLEDEEMMMIPEPLTSDIQPTMNDIETE